MLFRRITYCITCYYRFILLMGTAMAEDPLDVYLKQGKSLGKMFPYKELSQQEIDAITPSELRGKTFDGESSKNQLHSTFKSPENGQKDMDPRISAVIENAENVQFIEDSSEESRFEETIEKCLFEQEFVTKEIRYLLDVDVIRTPKVSQKNKACKGHYSEKKSRNPHADKKKQAKKFKEDPTIKRYSVTIEERGFGHRDLIVSTWVHQDNVPTCLVYAETEKEITPESFQEIDKWNIENSDLLDSLDCTVTHSITGSSEMRLIKNHEVSRPFWHKTLHLQCLKQKQTGCEFIKNKNCILVGENCLKSVGGQCIVWEKTFKCMKRRPQTASGNQNIYGLDAKLWDTDYQPNQDFSDVSMKLAVFNEMKQELQKSDVLDARNISLFSGIDRQCSKSIADEVMYDCCFEMDGFTNKIKLSKCTSDEIALAESKNKGLTHYIGIKKEKFLGLWVSRKEHIFCVFPTKLSRVFQEEARKQLQISWGDPDNPNCRGLTQVEIKKLNFSALNLEEAFQFSQVEGNQERIEVIKSRLKQRMEGR